MAESLKKKAWTRNVAARGLTKRLAADWEKASKGHLRRLIVIHQVRHGELDEGDNLPASVKPLVDGCKTYLKRGNKPIYGAGLIWDDNPIHCQVITSQVRVGFSVPCKTVIRVERFDAN
jgi:hypothetical protein